jgi:hypothetical protein
MRDARVLLARRVTIAVVLGPVAGLKSKQRILTFKIVRG